MLHTLRFPDCDKVGTVKGWTIPVWDWELYRIKMEDSGSRGAMQTNGLDLAFRTHAEGVRPVGGHVPAHIPRCTVWCGVGAPRRGAR